MNEVTIFLKFKMKLSAIVLAQAVSAKTDVHFNHDHEFPQVAELEKWEALAGKWFRLHGDNLRKSFSAIWSGPDGKYSPDGRFQKEIKKLKRSFARKCANKKTLHGRKKQEQTEEAPGADGLVQQVKSFNGTSIDDEYHHFKNITTFNTTRERRSDQNNSILNSGDRIRHVIRNLEEWVETTLSTCPKTENIINRWRRFAAKWEVELDTNPIFQEEIEEEKRNFRSQGSGNERCGVIYREFGLHGKYLYLYDAGVNPTNGYDYLGDTDFGNDQLMSMKPLPGMKKLALNSLNEITYFKHLMFKVATFELISTPIKKVIHRFVTAPPDAML